ncbi:hypothetical protein HG530_007560 [Fusarium avenaceum]|nr:hypothetical protein HG530_007560 [Fusarium avenaceum]
MCDNDELQNYLVAIHHQWLSNASTGLPKILQHSPQLRRIQHQALLALSTSGTIRSPFPSQDIEPQIRRSLAKRTSLQVKPVRPRGEIPPVASVVSVHERAHMHTCFVSRGDRFLESKLLAACVDWFSQSDIAVGLAVRLLYVFEVDDSEILVCAGFDEMCYG